MKQKTLLIVVLVLALFLRTYRISDFLGFWFDQGRDAKVVLSLWRDHKVFLIGPTTGIEGIFLGPFYYYFITPFYLLGNGNPIFPAFWLALVTTATCYLLYSLGKEYVSPKAGLLAAILYGLSYKTITDNRWLSNPTALPFFAVAAFIALLKIISGSKSVLPWLVLGLCIGLGLQLEAASAIFFLPAAALVIFTNRKSVQFNQKSLLVSVIFFGLTLLPQMAFDFRHEHILFNAFHRFLVTEKSFQPTVNNLYLERLNVYFRIFTDKFYSDLFLRKVFAVVTLVLFVVTFIRKLHPPKVISAGVIWWLTPIVILFFYHGNHGYIWEYYFNGVYPILIALVAFVWSVSFEKIHITRGIVALLLISFLYTNLQKIYAFLTQSEAPYISLSPMVSAVDWVYADASSRPFNVDVYVPPVIPHAYDYLFLWRGRALNLKSPQTELTSLLYTISEPDPGHPNLIGAWRDRQASYATIDLTQVFGPLTIERRTRYE